jgi:hypothetical protein
MSNKILHKRNLITGNIPTTASLDPGELAINVADGKLFLRQSGSIANQIVTVGLSSSFANTASYVENAQTASYALQAVTASFATSASRAVTSSFATSASWAPDTTFPYSGSAVIRGTLGINGSLTVLNSNSRAPIFDTVESIIYGQNTSASIDWDRRSLHASDGATSIHWGDRLLYDNNETLALDWSMRNAYSSTALVIDWENLLLMGPEGKIALDWQSRNTLDASGAPSIDWDKRQLIKSDGTTVAFDWENGALTSSLHGTASWANNAISSSFATSALTASYILPLKQEVQLTGSLNITGSTTQIGTNNLLGQTNLSGSIYVSGSMNALADITLAGTLRLDPAQDPGNTNETASFLFTSASNTEQGYDLYYRQDGNLVKFKWLEGGISSGLLYGGKITSSGSMIYVSSGSGIILDPNATFTKEINPLFTYVTWANYSASATYLTSSQNTYIYVDSAGTIHQQTNFFDQTQYEQAIPLGRVTHPNYSSITGIGSNVQTTYDSDSQQSAFIRAFGPIKVNGFSIQAHAGSLSFGVGSGIAYTLGGFYSQDPNSPSHYEGAATPTASIARAYRSGSGIRLDNNGGAFYTTIDPDHWDDGTGVLNTMASGDWQIQRVFFNPVSGRSTVYYGQNTYTTLLNALQYLATDSFTEGEFTANSLIFIGYLVLKGQTNNIADNNNNRVINGGIFRNIAGGSSGAGAVAQNLNDLSDVTITTPSNGQALVYNSGTWENGTPSFATTASFATQALTSSFATQALTSSFATSASWAPDTTFPYTGSAEITGSLKVTGSIYTNNVIYSPFVVALNFTFPTSYSYKAPYAYKVTSVESDPSCSLTILYQSSGSTDLTSSYVLGSDINKFDKLIVSSPSSSLILLNSIRI